MNFSHSRSGGATEKSKSWNVEKYGPQKRQGLGGRTPLTPWREPGDRMLALPLLPPPWSLPLVEPDWKSAGAGACSHICTLVSWAASRVRRQRWSLCGAFTEVEWAGPPAPAWFPVPNISCVCRWDRSGAPRGPVDHDGGGYILFKDLSSRPNQGPTLQLGSDSLHFQASDDYIPTAGGWRRTWGGLSQRGAFLPRRPTFSEQHTGVTRGAAMA